LDELVVSGFKLVATSMLPSDLGLTLSILITGEVNNRLTVAAVRLSFQTSLENAILKTSGVVVKGL
jgi:hypothetical protein